MQMQIYTPEQGQPLPPIQWNYVELRKEICAGLEKYKGRVYTPETIGSAKADRATLNKLADAIDGKRKEMKKLYLAPYEEFEGQAKELVALIKEQSDAIDAQVKAYEEARKASARSRCCKYTSLTCNSISLSRPSASIDLRDASILAAATLRSDSTVFMEVVILSQRGIWTLSYGTKSRILAKITLYS